MDGQSRKRGCAEKADVYDVPRVRSSHGADIIHEETRLADSCRLDAQGLQS